MASYIIILVWPVVVAVIARMTQSKKPSTTNGQIVLRYKLTYPLIAVLPLIYYTATRGYFADTGAYILEFYRMPTDFALIEQYMSNVQKDELFYFASALIKILFTTDHEIYFALIAFFQIFILIYVYNKYSENVFLSLFLFIASTDYISWMYNGIRQFVAVCLTFICFGLILKKKYIPAIIIIAFASFFHGTAWIVIPFMFIAQGKAWNKKTLLFIFGIIFAVLFIDQFTGILDNLLVDTQYSNVVSDWESSEDDGTNLIRVLVYSLPAILALIGRNKIVEQDNPVINLCANMSIAAAGFYIISMFTSGIFMGRLPIYFSLYNYILLPWEIKHIFQRDVSRTLSVVMIIAYLGYYFYSLKFGFGLI